MLREVPADPVSRLLSLLKNVRKTANGWQACCPAHADEHPSLSIRQGHDGRALVKCRVGCETSAVLSALGLQLRDLFVRRDNDAKPSLGEPVAYYDYRDAEDKLVYQVVRFRPKAFRPRQPDGKGGWAWHLQGVPRVLYRLAELREASKEEMLFVVEGEKDVDNLLLLGVPATCNVGGAGKWQSSYSEELRGRHVCIVPDNDAAGRRHAAAVASALLNYTASVRVLELPDLPDKGDVSDWLGGFVRKEGEGGSLADAIVRGGAVLPPGGLRGKQALLILAAQAPAARTWLANYQASETASPAAATADGEEEALLRRVADVAARPIRWLWPGRLALGKLAILDGDPGLGKSLVTLDLCARISSGRALADEAAVWPGDVIIVNCEDGVADTIRPRLEGLGADLQRIHVLRGPFSGGREQLPSFPRDLSRLERAIARCRAVLVVIDPIMAFLDESICTGNDQSVRQALAPLAALAEAAECAVLMVRHLNKSGGARAIYRGGGSIGIIGACRSAWLIGRHPDDERQRVLAQTKNNLARPQPSLVYQVDSGAQDWPRVCWLGQTELSADDLMALPSASPGGGERDRAAALLQQLLRDGPRPIDEALAELKQQGISRRTAFRAKSEMAVQTEMIKGENGSQAVWRLAPPGDAPAVKKTATQIALDILNRDAAPPSYLGGY